MQASRIEPGLLHVFRWLTALELGSMTLFLVVTPLRRGMVPDIMPLVLLLAGSLALLLLYLTWPPIQRLFGRWFLPIPLALIAVCPIFNQHVTLIMRLQLFDEATLVGAWQLIPVLFVPLVLSAWQYRMPGVILFAAVTTTLDAILTLGNPLLADQRLYQLMGVMAIRTASFVLVGGIVAQIMGAQQKQRARLAEANLRLLTSTAALEQLAVSRERNRMARELHDTLAHTLSAVSVQLEALKTVWDSDPQAARSLLDQTLIATRSGLTETRRALQALRASPLEDLGLALALRTMAQTAAERAGFGLALQIDPAVDNLPPDTAQHVYRTAQEALENIVRHSGASSVEIRLECGEKMVTLLIQDNGSGFDPALSAHDEQFGLRGMQERAALAGGRLNIESQPGQGAAIRLALEVNG